MRNLIILTSIGLAALACGGAVASRQSRADRDAADAARFAKAVAGLTPRETSDCYPISRPDASLSAYGTKLVYRVSNKLSYVTETGGGCEAVARGDILITHSNFGQLCRGDIATTVDSSARMMSGSCAIGSFTAWRK